MAPGAVTRAPRGTWRPPAWSAASAPSALTAPAAPAWRALSKTATALAQRCVRPFNCVVARVSLQTACAWRLAASEWRDSDIQPLPLTTTHLLHARSCTHIHTRKLTHACTHVNAHAQCAPGRGFDAANSTCTQCAAGSFAPGGAEPCSCCAANSVSTAAGAAACTPCANNGTSAECGAVCCGEFHAPLNATACGAAAGFALSEWRALANQTHHAAGCNAACMWHRLLRSHKQPCMQTA